MKKLLLSLALLCAPLSVLGQATQLQGTLNNPDGTGFNGQLIMSLAQEASISSASGCGGPVLVPSTVQVIIKIVNGAGSPWPLIYGSDCTLPYGVPYNVTARDNNGNVAFTAQWLPLGTIQDIGTIQSVVNPLGTLFGLSLSDIALTNAQNSFSQNNTFQQNVVVNGNVTVGGALYGPVGNGVTIVGNAGASLDLKVVNSAGTTTFQVYDNGSVTVPSGFFTVAGLIDTLQGYFYNGTGGITGQCLVSNGTAFVPGTCGSGGGGGGSSFYQTVNNNGVTLTQRNILNFSSNFNTTDVALSSWSNVDLSTTGVTAGSYTNPVITVDAFGRLTAASSTTGPTQIIKSLNVTTGICTTGSAAYSSCATPITWTTPFADANYTPVCTPGYPTNQFLGGFWIDQSSVSASGLTVWIQNGDGSGAHNISVSEIFCTGVHP